MNEFETLQKITELFAQLPAIERDYILARLSDDNKKMQPDTKRSKRAAYDVTPIGGNGHKEPVEA